MSNKTIYCSLDIETSGFDPLKHEILEVGFILFKIEDLRFKILEEWTQVFKPSKEVSPQVFALTGITQEELNSAPKFSEFHEFLQGKLGSAIIVGHNIVFDIKFLETFGIKFSGQTIDTLDLAQWLLPTHHSYNLENLMHTFGISHKDAHRALADAQATLKLLQKLLGVFAGFPKELQSQIKSLIKPHGFTWQDFFEAKISPVNLPAKISSKIIGKYNSFVINPGKIYNFNFGENYIESVASSLRNKGVNCLLVVPKAQQALDLYRMGLADETVFNSDISFDEKKFKTFLNKENLTPEELKFLLKVLVWKNTNWQTKTVLDLNFSFFGGQFKNLICGKILKESKAAKLVVTDQKNFLQSSTATKKQTREVVICGLNELEQAITEDLGTKTSWGYLIYLLKSFYNPELNLGKEEYKENILEGLAAADLFFGLVSALLKSQTEGFEYFKISEETENNEKFIKIMHAAEHLSDKLDSINQVLKSEQLNNFKENLQKFFADQPNRVRWVELAETRCALVSMPIQLAPLFSKVLKNTKRIALADALGPQVLFNYFIHRFGLENFELETAKAEKKTKQGDLFDLVRSFSGKKTKLVFHFEPRTATADEITDLILNKKSLPGAVLFSSSLQVRDYYEQNFEKLKEQAAILAQSATGGGNKLLRNFGISKKSLLLATDKFILKQLNNSNQVDPVQSLQVNTLILNRLPFEQFSHPYQEAVSKSFSNPFMEFALPKALLNFVNILKFFYSSDLKEFYIFDPKLAKEYASCFLDLKKLF